MKLEELAAGQSLSGIEPTYVVSVVAVVSLAEGSIQLICPTPDGAMKERLLGRADEGSIAIASSDRPFSFEGDDAAFQLACEASRRVLLRVRQSTPNCARMALLFSAVRSNSARLPGNLGVLLRQTLTNSLQ
jgi:hypothetical protein